MADMNDALMQFLQMMQAQQGGTPMQAMGGGGGATPPNTLPLHGMMMPPNPALRGMMMDPTGGNGARQNGGAASFGQQGASPGPGPTPFGNLPPQPFSKPQLGPPGSGPVTPPPTNFAGAPQVTPETFAPPPAQQQGAAGASGAQMTPGILAAMMQRLFGMQPQGQPGQTAPNFGVYRRKLEHIAKPQGQPGQTAPNFGGAR